ncbi:MAG: two-component system response regulator [Chloroflexota bacterium]
MDDDDANRRLVAALLRDEGYEVAEAADGQQALDHLKTTQPEAIVLDLMMPVVDGFTFLIERRKLPGCAAIPVVVLTAVHDLSELVGALGVKIAIAKPFEATALLDAVDNLLSADAAE